MTSLLDLAPSAIKVHGVPVSGYSIAALAALAGRFPEVRALLTGESVDITPDLLLNLAPQAVAAIIAGGTGKPDDKKHEAAAAALPLAMQIDFIEGVIAATVGPDGPGPFVERLAAMAGKVTTAEPAIVVPEPAAPPASLTPSQIRSTKFAKQESKKL